MHRFRYVHVSEAFCTSLHMCGKAVVPVLDVFVVCTGTAYSTDLFKFSEIEFESPSALYTGVCARCMQTRRKKHTHTFAQTHTFH